ARLAVQTKATRATQLGETRAQGRRQFEVLQTERFSPSAKRCRHTIRRMIHWFVSAKKLITSPAASAQKVYILHKKPSLSGTLCAKPKEEQGAYASRRPMDSHTGDEMNASGFSPLRMRST